MAGKESLRAQGLWDELNDRPLGLRQNTQRNGNPEKRTTMSFIDRLHNEKSELHHKLTSLRAYIGTAQFNSIPTVQQSLLLDQSFIMASYHDILETRLRLLEPKSDAQLLKEQWDAKISSDLEAVITGAHRDEPPAFND